MFQGEASKVQITYHDGNDTIYLDDFIKSVVWTGDISWVSRRIDVDLNAIINGDKPAFTIENGKEIRFYNNGVELFRGVVFSSEMNSDGQMRIYAFDEAIYLNKNTDTRIFRKMTASQILKKICAEYGIAAGTIVDTGYVIPKLIFREKTLYQMIVIALTETRKQTGMRFFLYSEQGKLHLVERKDQVVRWVIERGVNMTNATRVLSIEELRNNVTVSGGNSDNPTSSNVRDSDSIKRYGMMKHVEEMPGDATKSQIDQRAKQLLKDLNKQEETCTVEALGIDDVFAGRAVYVAEPMTGMAGGFYVSSDTHRFENGTHTMRLNLSRADDLPELEYEAPPESKSSTIAAAVGDAPSKTASAVINAAKAYIGKTRYGMGWGRTESDRRHNKFDCSSFVKLVFEKAGVNIGGPFSDVSTETLVKEGRAISLSDVEPGDLIFANTYKKNGHVLIYVGGGKVIGCGRSGTKINNLSYWKSTYGIGAVRRVL
jgi:cell wall-associated NlpC family hydrolase